MLTAQESALTKNRNQVLAKSIFRHLKTEGFTHQQIIEFSAALLDQVTKDLKEKRTPQ